MLPTQYKATADGDWKDWTGGTVNTQLLDAGFGPSYAPYKINDFIVYSLKFSDGSTWNVNTGWL